MTDPVTNDVKDYDPGEDIEEGRRESAVLARYVIATGKKT